MIYIYIHTLYHIIIYIGMFFKNTQRFCFSDIFQVLPGLLEAHRTQLKSLAELMGQRLALLMLGGRMAMAPWRGLGIRLGPRLGVLKR